MQFTEAFANHVFKVSCKLADSEELALIKVFKKGVDDVNWVCDGTGGSWVLAVYDQGVRQGEGFSRVLVGDVELSLSAASLEELRGKTVNFGPDGVFVGDGMAG